MRRPSVGFTVFFELWIIRLAMELREGDMTNLFILLADFEDWLLYFQALAYISLIRKGTTRLLLYPCQSLVFSYHCSPDEVVPRLYFYYSLSYEMTDDLADIRGNLLSLYHSVTLHHNELGQETLLNLLLCNYLHYNLYDQLDKLRLKAPRSEAHSYQQVLSFSSYSFISLGYFTFLDYIKAKAISVVVAREMGAAYTVKMGLWESNKSIVFLGEMVEFCTLDGE
ncbi:unnamed protein product, partial [Eruca vesicaria subsp. sativa]|nr:unnamed protein product [Eruca vesicaria subsp. sativa]